MSGFHQASSGLFLPNSVSTRKKPSEDLDELDIFARNGLVCIRRPTEDGSDTVFKQLSTKTAHVRAQKMEEEVQQWQKMATGSSYAKDKIAPLQRFIAKLRKAISEAELQGPFEFADMRRARVRAAPTQISVVKYGDI